MAQSSMLYSFYSWIVERLMFRRVMWMVCMILFILIFYTFNFIPCGLNLNLTAVQHAACIQNTPLDILYYILYYGLITGSIVFILFDIYETVFPKNAERTILGKYIPPRNNSTAVRRGSASQQQLPPRRGSPRSGV